MKPFFGVANSAAYFIQLTEKLNGAQKVWKLLPGKPIHDRLIIEELEMMQIENEAEMYD